MKQLWVFAHLPSALSGFVQVVIAVNGVSGDVIFGHGALVNELCWSGLFYDVHAL